LAAAWEFVFAAGTAAVLVAGVAGTALTAALEFVLTVEATGFAVTG